MRITNDTVRTAFLTALQHAQSQIAATQTQVGTGRRINSPSDDPIAAARVAHFEASLSRLEQFGTNAVFARHQLALEEETLGGAIEHLQRIRELLLQANSTSDADRRIIAQDVRQNRDGLLALANTTDVDGRYLFAGYTANATPFTVGAGGAVIYNGDQGQRTLQIGDTRFVAVADSGAEIFQRIRTGNGTFALAANTANTGSGLLGAGTVVDASAYVADTYDINFLTPTSYEVRDSANTVVTTGTVAPPAQSIAFRGINIELGGAPAAGDSFTVTPSAQRDVFATLDTVVATLETASSDPAARARLHGELGQQLVDLDRALEHMIDARAEIGARMRSIDQEEALGQDFAVHLTETLSVIRDLDYAEALSRLSQQLFGLDAAQQAFARTQGLSLFKYL